MPKRNSVALWLGWMENSLKFKMGNYRKCTSAVDLISLSMEVNGKALYKWRPSQQRHREAKERGNHFSAWLSWGDGGTKPGASSSGFGQWNNQRRKRKSWMGLWLRKRWTWHLLFAERKLSKTSLQSARWYSFHRKSGLYVHVLIFIINVFVLQM